jgi:transposase
MLASPTFPCQGQPAEAPWRPALLTLLQITKSLSDRQAAYSIRNRIDRGCLVSLPLSAAAFDSMVLSEFRSRLVAGAAEEVLLDNVLELASAHQLLKAAGRLRSGSTHLLVAVRTMNRAVGPVAKIAKAVNGYNRKQIRRPPGTTR